jgi:glycosyltransferase involved in cell wall biosynthesis
MSQQKTPESILFITGSYPPNVCGVGDYTKRLFTELSKNTVHTFKLFNKQKWSFKYLINYLREIKSLDPSIIHLQYPTEGFGYSFVPLFLLFFLKKIKIIVTLHEISSRTYKAKIYTYFLALISKTIVVTNDVEKQYIQKRFLFINKEIIVINIGSNIPKSDNINNKDNKRVFDLCYFGHIRPNKGIDHFFEVVKKMNQKSININAVIIGQTLIKYSNFAEQTIIDAQSLNIKTSLNKPEEHVADMLCSSKIAYLPFPDGVSSRRGSLIAAGINKCLLVSTFSKDEKTNLLFEKYCYLVENTEETVIVIQSILDGTALKKIANVFFDSYSWDLIAEQHLKIYENI